ncbi:MAG: DUF6404 family protein [Paracoccaceae bacterium]
MTDRDFERRFEAAKAEMAAAGLKPSTAIPPLTRLFRAVGIMTRPPLYQSFATTALQYGLFFGAFWGLFMYLLIWRNQGMPFIGALFAATVAGVLFGLMMAAVVAWQARKHKLTDWNKL